MATAVLLVTQTGQDFVNVPASQNVWLAGMAEGFSELGLSVHIPWELRDTDSSPEEELSRVSRRFSELYGVAGPEIEFFDSRELHGPSLPRRFDVLWARDSDLLLKSGTPSQVKIAEFHGGARETLIPERAREVGAPLVTVTNSWSQRFGAHCVSEPGALRVFFKEDDTQRHVAEKAHGVYAGGLDPDRIDGIGVRTLRELLRYSPLLHVIGGNLSVEVDILRWRLGRKRHRAKFYGYLPPAITARLLHSADFAVALKAEDSAPSAPIKLISFAAAKLPLLVSPAFSKPDYSGSTARTLKVHNFNAGVSPQARDTLRRALASASTDVPHNYQIASDNTYAKRIEKTGLLQLFT